MLIFLILASFWLRKTSNLQLSDNFGHDLLILLSLVSFWLSKTGQIWGFWRVSSECMEGMAYLTCILTTFFNCLYFGHGLLIFSILVVFWLSETSQMCSFRAFSWECMAGIGWTNLWKKQKKLILPYENYPVTERGISLTAVLSDFSRFLFFIKISITLVNPISYSD